MTLSFSPSVLPSEELLDAWIDTVHASVGYDRSGFRWLATVAAQWGEKQAKAAKDLALNHLAFEREKIMRMSHEEALQELINVHKIEGRTRVINAVADTGVLEIR